MPEPTITYTPRPDAKSISEVSVLASIYKLAISSHSRKEATRPGSPDDAKGSSHDRARTIIQEPK
jgi:hypothetical protein